MQRRLDMVGVACPLPLFEVQKEMNLVPSGTVIVVETAQSAAIANIVEWAKAEGHPYQVIVKDRNLWEIHLTKR
ncbi:MAG: sulfurtransferase TusA family protein [Firmicutes bacterium]|nr:sulfurtransferase TusA family protein [Bacillota bacterium]MCL5040286.1 sulfurtransferase TusA family protein [Bacillota bacterium]